MGSYALQDMLRIRTMREDRSGKQLVVARRERDVAQVEVNRSEQKLEDFRSTKELRRNRLYDSVMKRLVKRETLENLRERVANIDEQEHLLEVALADAEHVLETKEENAEKARIRYVVDSKNKSKIEMHRSTWLEEEKKAQEHQDDNEMEEFAGNIRKMTNDDYDDFQ